MCPCFFQLPEAARLPWLVAPSSSCDFFFFWTVSGLNCGTRHLHCGPWALYLWPMWNLSSTTRDLTLSRGIGGRYLTAAGPPGNSSLSSFSKAAASCFCCHISYNRLSSSASLFADPVTIGPTQIFLITPTPTISRFLIIPAESLLLGKGT